MKRINFLYTLLFLLIPGLSEAYTKKTETFAIVGFFIVAGVGITIYYIIWKNKNSVGGKGKERYKIKTMEVMQNGRKIVISKKYRVIEDEKEFPKELKRSASGAKGPVRPIRRPPPKP